MERLLLVAAGGAIGSGLRYLVATWAVGWLGVSFPWGTLLVNLTGSFLIGVVQALAVDGLALGEDTRLFLATGILGGFTTYSAFSYETVALMHRGAWTTAWLNVVLTTSCCLVLCYAGLLTGRVLVAKF
jgi:fluoride exporter